MWLQNGKGNFLLFSGKMQEIHSGSREDGKCNKELQGESGNQTGNRSQRKVREYVIL